MFRGNFTFKYLERIIVIVIVITISALGVRAVDNFRDQGKSPCPAEMAFVPSSTGGFCIDKYEASPSKDCQYIFPMNQEDTRINMENLDCEAVSKEAKRPWVFISQIQAEQMCARSAKRLATPKEWHIAALGSVDNDDCQLNNNWPQQPGPSAYEEKCQTGSGIMDMIGNTWEWVAGQVVDGVYGDKILPQSGYIADMDSSGLATKTNIDSPNEDYHNDYWWLKSIGTKAIAKGGYFASSERGGMFATYIELSPIESSIGTGFRCVR